MRRFYYSVCFCILAWNSQAQKVTKNTDASPKPEVWMKSKFDSKPNYYKCKTVDGLRIEGAYSQRPRYCYRCIFYGSTFVLPKR